MAKKAILLHQEQLTPIGVDIKPIAVLTDCIQPPHRDDHYMFIIQQKGQYLWELDFNHLSLKGSALCFIAPGQVHRYIRHKKSEGWLLFVETELVSKTYRDIFDTVFHNRQAVSIKKEDPIFELTAVLEKLLTTGEASFKRQVIHSLVDTIIGILAAKATHDQYANHTVGSQKHAIATKFKQLVKEQYKEHKQVKDYAASINITPLYLNEVMKEITGLAASYWIHQEIVMEAKRLLYYTELDVKEIAYNLGYEDHAYFSRFFRKNTGMTASEFRNAKP
jgi:AraC-like DNA-binding protein